MTDQTSDNLSGIKLVRQTYETPKSRQKLVALLETIITDGGVKKIVVEIGQPIKVDRLVPEAFADGLEAPPIEEIVEDDIFFSIRNHDMKDIPYQDGLNPFEYIFKGFQLATSKRFRPTIFLIPKESIIRTWFGIDEMFYLEKVFGVEVLEHKSVPDYSAILACEDPELGTIAFSVKFEINVPKKKKEKKE